MEKIILDVDTGVDDFFSILVANKLKNEFYIEGITTVAGNCNVDNATKNTLKALNLEEDSNVKVYKGAAKPLSEKESKAGTDVHGYNGLGGINYDEVRKKEEEMSAEDFLISKTKEEKGDITIISSGPLTNIANSILKDIKFPKNIKRLVLMGGSIGRGNVTPYAECNFYKDAIAADIVFRSGIKEIVMMPLDIAKKVVITNNVEEMLLNLKDEKAKFLYDITRLGAINDAEYGGAVLYDPVTICYLLNKDVVKIKSANVKITTQGIKEGESIVDFNNNVFNCNVAYEIDVNKTKDLIFTTLFEKEINKVREYL